MCACNQNTASFGDEDRIDVVLAQCHVGTILAIEYQWKMLLIANAENNERGQAFGISDDTACVHAFAFQLA